MQAIFHRNPRNQTSLQPSTFECRLQKARRRRRRAANRAMHPQQRIFRIIICARATAKRKSLLILCMCVKLVEIIIRGALNNHLTNARVKMSNCNLLPSNTRNSRKYYAYMAFY